jgi:UDP-N-acetyl-D-mannosaminuronic acid dehydrogenase
MINVIGQGYIGLPTALMLAAHGSAVIGTDTDVRKIGLLRSGELPFAENGLRELFDAARANISFACAPAQADVYIVTVPTPYDKQSKRVDAAYVVRAVKDVISVCPSGAILVIESTVAPGTVDQYVRPLIADSGKGRDVHLVHAPERIMPGKLVKELVSNARTIGADLPEIAAKIKAVYETFCKGEIVLTDIRTAEMTKVVENTFRDISIAYANELVKICRSDGLDVHEIIRIANKHPRVKILSPGPGVGGHCIPVDPWFLVGDYPTLANVVRAARQVNDSMPQYVIERTVQVMGLAGVEDVTKVGFYGLTYKEDVDDIRESPTLQLLDVLRAHMAPPPRVYDPFVKHEAVPNQAFGLQEFLEGLDMVVIMVGHGEIIARKEMLADKVILDTRNVIDMPSAYLL